MEEWMLLSAKMISKLIFSASIRANLKPVLGNKRAQGGAVDAHIGGANRISS